MSMVIDVANIHEHAAYPSVGKATAPGPITSDFDIIAVHRPS